MREGESICHVLLYSDEIVSLMIVLFPRRAAEPRVQPFISFRDTVRRLREQTDSADQQGQCRNEPACSKLTLAIARFL